MVFSYFVTMMLIISTLGENCDDIMCADVFDDVCGMAESKDGTQMIMKYKNICYMKKEACELEPFVEIIQVADELCDIETKSEIGHYNEEESRRVTDFSIVGAHQACNHSCPTYCTEAYEPACAQIWKENMEAYTFRTMVNHCHIDMFSCAAGVNVTIIPLSKCYKDQSAILFMQHAAAMKSLHLIEGDGDPRKLHSRRKNAASRDEEGPVADTRDHVVLKEQLFKVIRRIFKKYFKTFD